MYESDDKMVSHPKHYISKNGLEVIDVIEAFTDGLEGIEATDTGNIIKYACRWKQKGGIQDLKKIMWYTQHLIDYLEDERRIQMNFNETEMENNRDYNLTFLKAQQNHFNDLLMTRGYVSEDDVRDALGIKRPEYTGVNYIWEMKGEHEMDNRMNALGNLIVDMTLKGATAGELEKVVSYSMDVINAEKSVKASYEVNDIASFEKKYQG